MYTVGIDKIPSQERTNEAVELMTESLIWVSDTQMLVGLGFTGEVLSETESPTLFEILGYTGLVTGITVEPPTFNLLVQEAWKQTGFCDCPYDGNVDEIYENFDLAMEKAQISQDLDDFAEVETKDPHYEELPLLVHSEISIRFDRLGAYGVFGVIKK